MGDTVPLDAEAIQSSALWHYYDFDPERQTARLFRLNEAVYRQASFLDQRVEPLATAQAETRLSELEQALQGAESTESTAHFIFHHGHCGSTLLSRALAASGKSLPVREPLTLRRLASAEHSAGLLQLAVNAHSRTFQPRQIAMVKATSICNSLIQPILAANPHSRAMLIYVPLESFLAGMLGKQTPALDLRGHAAHRLADWNTISAAPAIQAERLSEAQLAVLAWLTSMNLMATAASEYPVQAHLLNFEALLASPESGLTDCCRFYDLEPEIDAIVAAWPDISTAYSKKTDEPYSAFNRNRTLQRGRMTRSAEIQHGLSWAKKMIHEIEALHGLEDYL